MKSTVRLERLAVKGRANGLALLGRIVELTQWHRGGPQSHARFGIVSCSSPDVSSALSRTQAHGDEAEYVRRTSLCSLECARLKVEPPS